MVTTKPRYAVSLQPAFRSWWLSDVCCKIVATTLNVWTKQLPDYQIAMLFDETQNGWEETRPPIWYNMVHWWGWFSQGWLLYWCLIATVMAVAFMKNRRPAFWLPRLWCGIIRLILIVSFLKEYNTICLSLEVSSTTMFGGRVINSRSLMSIDSIQIRIYLVDCSAVDEWFITLRISTSEKGEENRGMGLRNQLLLTSWSGVDAESIIPQSRVIWRCLNVLELEFRQGISSNVQRDEHMLIWIGVI